MQPAAGAMIYFFRDGGGEGDDVVVEGFLQFLLPFDEPFQIGEAFFRAGFYFREIGVRHDALIDKRFAGEQFDLQPDF